MKTSIKQFATTILLISSHYAVAQAPANDNPCNAILLSAGSSCSFSAFTNANATSSTGVPAPGCAGYTGGDVWFKVKVPASGNLIFDSDTGYIKDGGMAIYSGNCSTLSLLECNDDSSTNGPTPHRMPKINLCYLTPGDTLWIRFWEFFGNSNGTFKICVYDGGGGVACPMLVANDEPCNATILPVGNSCSFTISTNTPATSTQNVLDPVCASYSGGDVWFKVKVPASGHLVFDSDTAHIKDGGMAIYSGTCSALSLIECDDDDSQHGAMPLINKNSLTPGDTIWIRFWEYNNNNNGTFNICIWDGVFTSVLNEENTVDVMTFPNPFSETTTITITGGQVENYELKIFNVFGQETHMEIARNSSGFTLQRNEVASGIYMYHIIMNNKKVYTGKLIIQ